MKLYFIAGEPSGDLHGKNLLQALSQLQPGLQARGVGGDGLASQGMSLVRHIRDTNFMGFIQVVRNLGTIRQLFRDVKADLLAFQPDAVVLIDYPGFNLRMAKFCREHGIRVLYYISPQVWAWKKNRVKKIRRDVDRMFVILPFEKDFYAGEGVEVDFVGHPLLDEIQDADYGGAELKDQLLGEVRKTGKVSIYLVALLPGSRKQEISRMLPRMLSIRDRFPECQFVIAGAPSQEPSFYQELLGHILEEGSEGEEEDLSSASNPLSQTIPVLHNQTYKLLSAADFALVTSGTATLETALFQVPEVVCYAANPLSVWLARRLIKVKFISLVNLILDREAVRELIQAELNPIQLEAELRKLMEPEPAEQLRQDYRELRQRLGDTGASQRTAQRMLAWISQSQDQP